MRLPIKTKKAELGISTLIILASLILVSAIIFMAFTTTANVVNHEARSVAMTVRDNVGSAMNVVKLYAEDATTGSSVDYFYEEIKPPYASNEIKLTDAVLLFSLSNTSREYSYLSTIDCSNTNVSQSTSIYNDSNRYYFGVEYVAGNYTYNNTIAAGELVRLCWKSPVPVFKDNKVIVTLIGKYGHASRLVTSYQKLMKDDKIVYFFP